MILDLVITKTDDGFSAEVPSIKGCESWAHNEDDVIEKSIELVKFYLKIPDKKIKIDLARKEDPIKIYKIIFDK
ncbi:MAG: hypothetical protein HZA74_00945 [Ignavibacteriales bacterium]|nr:hypothetical protein [Ignavibacteriales bacterium]